MKIPDGAVRNNGLTEPDTTDHSQTPTTRKMAIVRVIAVRWSSHILTRILEDSS